MNAYAGAFHSALLAVTVPGERADFGAAIGQGKRAGLVLGGLPKGGGENVAWLDMESEEILQSG